MLPINSSNHNNTDDDAAIRKIYDENYGLLIHVATEILNDYALAEDAVAESLIKINRNLHVLEKLTCYQQRAYIVNIVKNTSIDFLRKQSTENILDVPDDFFQTIPDEKSDVLGELIMNESYNSVKEAIKRLPEPLKDVLALSVLYERSHEEISQLLKISRDASKMRLYRAKQKIREFLAGERNGK